ncbi:MAG: ISNCY family transposase [Chloroflexi bacterium]|nr:ISNCY family transposase [Chloroflexota bacterium]
MITYPQDERFLHNPLVQQMMQLPTYRQMHDVMDEVFRDPQVRLSLRHDWLAADSQAAWNGRPAVPLVVCGSLIVLRRWMGWSYRLAMEEVSGSMTWRWVCQLYYQRVPNYRTLQAREAQLSARTVHLIHTRVVALAQRLGFTDGRRVRLDSSVTESNIHDPTDSSLLNDAARVLSRLLRRAGAVLPQVYVQDKAWFRDRHRQARRLAREIGRLTAQAARRPKKAGKRDSLVRRYGQLLGVVEALLEQVHQVSARLAQSKVRLAHRLHTALCDYVPLVEQVVDQTRRRVVQGLRVPAEDKVVSVFEPHTSILCRGKAPPHDTEFGHKVWFVEVNGGFISAYRVLTGNPPDAQFVIPSLKAHRRHFHAAPRQVSGDRGLFSPANEQQARALGVRQVSLPQPGHKSARRRRYERQRWFRAAQRFRNGIEGRISQLRRARRLNRCLNHGWSGFERWVGWGVIANNMAVIVSTLIRRRSSVAKRLALAAGA